MSGDVRFTREFWDERYSSAGRLWSGNPNPHLVDRVADLSPGTALDVGSGEGADAVWLAVRGWRVTGVDVSQVALDRAAGHAADAGVGDLTSWQRADLMRWEPPAAAYDLVSAQFMHLPRVELDALHRRLATAVRPGGSLLLVGHHPADRDAGMRPDIDAFFTAEEVAATLDPGAWTVLLVADPVRDVTDPDGHPLRVRDTVLHAVRRET